LWDEQDFSKKKFENATLFNFMFPKLYFTFLDSYEPSSNKSVSQLNDVLNSFEAEQILFGLIKRVRQLLILKAGNYMDFSEFAKMQSWQLGKLKMQSAKWSEKQLEKALLLLSELDEKLKTSALPMPLSNHLDIILIPDLN
jgi:DNA polymerase III delta subunit